MEGRSIKDMGEWRALNTLGDIWKNCGELHVDIIIMGYVRGVYILRTANSCLVREK